MFDKPQIHSVCIRKIINLMIENSRLEPWIPALLFSHFLMAGQNRILNDVSITFIDKTHIFYPLRREDCWRKTLKTMILYGLSKYHHVLRIMILQ